MNNRITAVDVLMPTDAGHALVLVYRQTFAGTSTTTYRATPSSLRRAQAAQRALLEQRETNSAINIGTIKTDDISIEVGNIDFGDIKS